MNKGLPIFVYVLTTNLCFVLYHSLEWDAICGSCGNDGMGLLKNETFKIELSCCFV